MPLVEQQMTCAQAYKCKMKVFKQDKCSSVKYKNASRRCSRVQKQAKKWYNLILKGKLSKMQKSEKSFWELAKEISGQPRAGSKAAPNVEELVDHFAQKMSNGADAEDNTWEPADGRTKKLTSFKNNLKDGTMLCCNHYKSWM
jgi:hypothetical protein